MSNFLGQLRLLKFSSSYSFRVPESTVLLDYSHPIVYVKGKKEPLNIDGFTLGNKEIFAAVGMPHYTVEPIYQYYSESDTIERFFSASNVSLFVGPKKHYNHLKVLLNEFRCQDYAIKYEKNGKTHIIPFWMFDEQYIYRVQGTPIVLSKFRNSDLLIELVTFAALSEENVSLPIMPRILGITNISSTELKNVEIYSIFANKSTNWEISIEKKYHVKFREKEKQNNCPYMSYITQDVFERYSCIQDFDEFSELAISENDFQQLEVGKKYDSSKGIILSTKKEIINSGCAKIFNFSFVANDSENQEEFNAERVHNFDYYQHFLVTYKYEKEWSELVHISTDDPKINEFIDSMTALMRIHEGFNAIHLGSTVYDHNSAFFRDNYWVQRAYFKAGRYEAAIKNFKFFSKAVEKNGLSNSYGISSLQGHSSSMEMRAETPAFFPLMTQNYYLWTKDADDVFELYPILKTSMKEALYAPNGLFILNSDETWIWPSYVNEVDYYIDNSYLMIAAADFMQNLAYSIDTGSALQDLDLDDKIKRLKGTFSSEYFKYNLKKEDLKGFLKYITNFKVKIITSALKHYYIQSKNLFASSTDITSLKDNTAIVQLTSTPLLFSNLDEILQEQINHSSTKIRTIFRNSFDRTLRSMTMLQSHPNLALFRSHSRTTASVGNIFGYSIYAATELNYSKEIIRRLFESALNSLSCTGSSTEIFDIYYPRWCTEQRRLWDSLSIFEGVLHYLFEIQPGVNLCVFSPKIINENGYSVIKDIQIHSNKYIIVAYHPQSLENLLNTHKVLLNIKEGIMWSLEQIIKQAFGDEYEIESSIQSRIPSRYRNNEYLIKSNMTVKEIFKRSLSQNSEYKFCVQTTLDGYIVLYDNNSIGLTLKKENRTNLFMYLLEGEPLSNEALEYISQLNLYKMKEMVSNLMFEKEYHSIHSEEDSGGINSENLENIIEPEDSPNNYNIDSIVQNLQSLVRLPKEDLFYILNKEADNSENIDASQDSSTKILQNDIFTFNINQNFLKDLETLITKNPTANELVIVNHNVEDQTPDIDKGTMDNIKESEFEDTEMPTHEFDEKKQPSMEDTLFDEDIKIKDFTLSLKISKCPILFIDTEQIKSSSSTNFNGITIDIVFFENTHEYELLIMNRSSLPLIYYNNGDFVVIPDLGSYSQSGYIQNEREGEEKEDLQQEIEEEKNQQIEITKKEIMESIVWNMNMPTAILLYDQFSEQHAKEIYRELVLLKSTDFIHQLTDFEIPLDSLPYSHSMNLIIVTKLQYTQLLDLERYEPIVEEETYSIWKDVMGGKRYLIIVQNHGHVYRDTAELCNDLGTYLIPRRLKARSMFPYGFFRFLEEMGVPFGNTLFMRIITSKPINVYYNDKALILDQNNSAETDAHFKAADDWIKKEFDHAFTLAESFDYDIPNRKAELRIHHSFNLDTKKNVKIPSNKTPDKPYLIINSMNPYAPLEVSASGIASGKNMMRLIVDADCDEEMDIVVQVLFDLETHLAWLNGSQRERILDPCHLIKTEKGPKIFEAVLHPGRPVHPTALIYKDKPKRRTLFALFGRYPKWN